LKKGLLLLLLPLLFATPSFASIVNFEDVSSGTFGSFTSGGFDFAFFGVIDDSWGHGAHSKSASNFAYGFCCSLGQDSMTKNGGGIFNLIGGWFGNLQGATDSFTVHGFLGASEIYTQTLNVNGTTSYISMNFLGVDKVLFDSNFSSNLTLDDLETTTSVPEPATLLLMGIGLLGTVVARKRLA
jgi:hypothetical protein